ncbi:heavy metal-associated domain-containing protein, partial [Klebsiella oxytoca]
MYVCSTGSIPIALSLMLKGLSPGAAFVLLMAGPAANFASIIIVSKSLGKKTAAIYLGTIVIGAIAIGLCI